MSTIGQITEEKITFQRVGPRPSETPERKAKLTSFRRKENRCYQCGKQDTSNESILKKGRRRWFPLRLLRKNRGGQGLFYVDRSYQQPLINLKVGPKEKEITTGDLLLWSPQAWPSSRGGCQFPE
jgi:hypothetical protein